MVYVSDTAGVIVSLDGIARPCFTCAELAVTCVNKETVDMAFDADIPLSSMPRGISVIP